MSPVSDNSGKIEAQVYRPGTFSEGVPMWTQRGTKRVFNRALLAAVAFIKTNYEKVN